jgi:hypothetical protein
VDRGVSHGQRGGSPMVVNFSFLDRSLTVTAYAKLESHFSQYITIEAQNYKTLWSGEPNTTAA